MELKTYTQLPQSLAN